MNPMRLIIYFYIYNLNLIYIMIMNINILFCIPSCQCSVAIPAVAPQLGESD